MRFISFDPVKSQINLRARLFEWSSSLIVEDTRRDYGEKRFRAIGWIVGRLHVLVFTPRAKKVHVISLRKANDREVKLYVAKTQH
jgi:uncharacterized DUF497 family protein